MEIPCDFMVAVGSFLLTMEVEMNKFVGLTKLFYQEMMEKYHREIP